VEAEGRFVVAPDNGVVSRVLEQAESFRIVELDEDRFAEEELSSTFHGRDLFAPAAALLARGEGLDDLGPRIDDPIRLGEPELTESDGEIGGQVVSEDYFGNLVTNVPGERIRQTRRVEIQGRIVPVRTTYGDAEEGELLALVNSDDRLEVAVRNGSAAEELGAGPGTPVRVLPPEI
jgi:S-adenosylmethionine hydrolase